MPVTKLNVEQLEIFERRTSEVNKEVLTGIVPQVQKNFGKIVGKVLSLKFFYRQRLTFDDFSRRNLIARAFNFIAAVYFTNPNKGEHLIQFIESFFAWLRATTSDKSASAADFWDLAEEQSQLITKRQKAVSIGDKPTARELSQTILSNERKVPMMLKSAVIRRKRRRSSKVHAA